MNLVPTLLLIVCTEGYFCSPTAPQEYPMPDWATCLEAAHSGTVGPNLAYADTQEFAFAAFCVGKPAPEQD